MSGRGALICVAMFASGCVVAGGPVLAMRSTGPAVGWEAAGVAGAVGIVAGQSIPLEETGSTGYVAVHGAVFGTINAADTSTQDTFGMGGSLGYAGGEGGSGVMLAIAPMHVTMFDNNCTTSRAYVFTLELGLRWIGARAEVFFSPKIGAVLANISCT